MRRFGPRQMMNQCAGLSGCVVAFATLLVGCTPAPVVPSPPDAGNIYALPQGTCAVVPDGGESWCWRNPLPQGEPLYGVWGSSPTDVWAASSSGTMLHWDGTAWTTSAAGTANDLLAVWGDSPNDVWAVGREGASTHWSGGSWEYFTTPVGSVPGLPGLDLLAVWGSASDDVYAVGAAPPSDSAWPVQGTVIHWNGQRWSAVPRFPVVDLYGVWGSAEGDVWIVGNHNGMAPFASHFDGQVWVPMPTPPGEALRSINGTSSSDIWAVGDNGAVDHFNGSAWTSVSVNSGANFDAVWTPASGEVWAAGSGGAINHLLNGTWASVGPASQEEFTAVWGSSSTDVWVVGGAASILHLSDTGALGASFAATTADLHGAFASPDGSAVRFVGAPGEILRLSNGAWISENVAASSPVASPPVLTAIAGETDNDIWAVGLNGAMAHWDGSSWTPAPPPTSANLWGIGGINADWAVGDSGTALHLFNATWSSVPTPKDQALHAVFGIDLDDVWAVGDAGVSLQWDGSTWNFVPVPDAPDLVGVWGSDASHVWAVGGSRVYFYNGTAWAAAGLPSDCSELPDAGPGDAGPGDAGSADAGSQQCSSPSYEAVTGWIVGGVANVWAVGDSGVAVFWNGQTQSWSLGNTGVSASAETSEPINLFAATTAVANSTAQTWVAGSKGTVIELAQPTASMP